MKRLLAFALIALLSACATVAERTPQAAYPNWQYLGSKSYEQEQPGLGVGYKYDANPGWIDVYIYGLQRDSWMLGVSDPGFSAHFQSTIDEVQHFAKAGYYANIKIGQIRDIKLSGYDFRTVTFQYVREGKLTESATYLTAINGKLLKYRISLYSPATPSLDEIAQHFINQNLHEQLSAKVI